MDYSRRDLEYFGLPINPELPGKYSGICGGGGGSAPPPDPNIGLAEKQMADNATQLKDFYMNTLYPQQYAMQQKQYDLSQGYVKQAMDTQDQQNQWANQYHDRLQNTFYPIQDSLARESMQFNSGAEGERMAGQAMADSQQSYDQQMNANNANMASMGVNPNSGRFQSINQAGGVQASANQAAAMNQARMAARQLGWGMRLDAANMGQGLASQAGNAVSVGLGAGQSGIQAGQGNFNNTMSMSSGYGNMMGQAGNMYSQLGSMANQNYSNQLNAYQIQQNSSNSTFGALLGAGAGIAGAALGGPAGGMLGSMLGKSLAGSSGGGGGPR